MRGSGDYDRKKKRYSRLSGGCALNYDRKKKIQSSVCWVRGSGDYEKKKIHYDRKKKDTVVCLMGARFLRLRPEKKRYSRLSVGCAVLAITTGKKKDKVVCLASWAVWCVSFWFWREIGSFFVVTGNFHYDQKKKDTVTCWWMRDQLRPEKKIQSSVCLVCGSGDYDRKKKIQSK